MKNWFLTAKPAQVVITRYEYFIKTASRESEKIKGKQKDDAKASIKDDLLVDEEIIEEIISQNSTKNDEIEKEELRKIMKEILTTVNRLFAPPKKEVTEGVKKEESVKKEEANKELKKAEPKKAVEKQDVCGDGKITGIEICDGNLFSKMCLDAVADYKAVMGNPNLAPRCFNNCRGCEASATGY